MSIPLIFRRKNTQSNPIRKAKRDSLRVEALETRKLLAGDTLQTEASTIESVEANFNEVVAELAAWAEAQVGEETIEKLQPDVEQDMVRLTQLVSQGDEQAWRDIIDGSDIPELRQVLADPAMHQNVVDLVLLELVDVANEDALRMFRADQVIQQLIDQAPGDETSDPIQLPPQFEQLRLELGDEQFAALLRQNLEETGNVQGVPQEATQQPGFEEVESRLEAWLAQFERGQENPDQPQDAKEDNAGKDSGENNKPVGGKDANDNETPPPAQGDPRKPNRGEQQGDQGKQPRKKGEQQGGEQEGQGAGLGNQQDGPQRKNIDKAALKKAKRAFGTAWKKLEGKLDRLQHNLKLGLDPTDAQVEDHMRRLRTPAANQLRAEIRKTEQDKFKAERELKRERRKENPSPKRITKLENQIEELNKKLLQRKEDLKSETRKEMRRLYLNRAKNVLDGIQNAKRSLIKDLNKALDKIAKESKCPEIAKLVDQLTKCMNQTIDLAQSAIDAAKEGDFGESARQFKAMEEALKQTKAKVEQLCKKVEGLLK